MTNLNTIISTFSSEEQQRFLIYLKKKNKRNDIKNVALFKLIAKNALSSDAIFTSLYNTSNKNAYHALRKRLYLSIIDFIANTNLEEENSIDMQIIKFILASRNFFLMKEAKVAYHILDKAETLATEHHLFAILNEIYSIKIQYAYTNPSVDMEQLILKYNSNQKKHYLEDQLNIVYAKIRQALNNISYKKEIVDFETLLNDTLKEHHINIHDSISFKSLYQLMHIVSISAFVTKDYLKIESFLMKTYAIIKLRKTNEKEVFYHIQVVYMIANALFRNKKFKQSKAHLEVMHNLMLANKKKHYNTFILKHDLLLALNLNYSNKQEEAISYLAPYLHAKHTDTETLLDIRLSLIMFYIQNENLTKAKQVFSKFYHTDKYYIEKAGIEWTIKKNLTEILLQVELGDIDIIESRLQSFKRQYNTYLKEINQERVTTYLSFVEKFYKQPEIITTDKFKNLVEDSFEWIPAKQEDIFGISFYAWLKSKMEKRALFETTLRLIEQAQFVN
ncbi:hypothetical protein [Lacinutrix himadriensis]|uniref:hypothetical protein n=1 Tax=Lacinutrix himadriensis TaxID=641549 RepID=UPI0006E3A4E4|nr:hypothetical protein [Lacinutrix himadriensis]